MIVTTHKAHTFSGSGADSISLAWTNINNPVMVKKKAESAPSASMRLKLPKGRRIIELLCVPTHAINEKWALRTALCLGDNPSRIVDVNPPSGTEVGSKNVARGYSSTRNEFISKNLSIVVLQLSLFDPDIAIRKILIN